MAINNNVYEALQKCLTDSDCVIQADLDFFCNEAQGDKASAFKQIVMTFGTDEDPKL